MKLYGYAYKISRWGKRTRIKFECLGDCIKIDPFINLKDGESLIIPPQELSTVCNLLQLEKRGIIK
jgi:hypothetical protein